MSSLAPGQDASVPGTVADAATPDAWTCPDPESDARVAEALQRGVEYCRSAHRRACERPGAARWDYCVLTAANDRQAGIYQRELAERQERGLIPRQTRVRVVADPDGKRVGSGAATLYALRAVAVELWEEHLGASGRRASPEVTEASELFRGKRVLVLHAGGDSRRLPHCSALGKVLTTLPMLLPEGEVATVLDVLLTNLAGLAGRLDEGLLVASGDAVVTVDPRRISLRRSGVVGVAVSVSPVEASGHGVYASSRRGGLVARFLQKPSAAEMSAAGCIDDRGLAQVDTGLLKFDVPTVGALLNMAGVTVEHRRAKTARLSVAPAPLDVASADELSVDIYREIACALPAETTRGFYLASVAADGAAERVCSSIWDHLRERRHTEFRVISVSPALFTHFGSTSEYLDGVTRLSLFGRLHGFTGAVDSYFSPSGGGLQDTQGVCVLRSLVRAQGSIGTGSVIEDSELHGSVRAGERCLVSGMGPSGGALNLPPGTVLHLLPVRWRHADGEPQDREVAFVFGSADDPKLGPADARCQFLGAHVSQWLSRRGIGPEAVWDEGEPRTLWTARLFPVGERGAAWRLAEWMLRTRPDSGSVATWLAGPRTSMREAFECADLDAIIERRAEITALRHCLLVEDAAYSQVDVRTLVHQLSSPRIWDAVVRHLLRRASEVSALLTRARLLRVAADTIAAGIPPGSSLTPQEIGCRDLAHAPEYLTEQAFECVRTQVGAYLATPRPLAKADAPGHDWVWAGCPVRADFAGGWSDTPPSGLELGGTVLNAALTLRGELPLQVWGRRIPEPVLRLASRDRRRKATVGHFYELTTYEDPLQPLGIHKAAFPAAGILPDGGGGTLSDTLAEAGGGYELITDSRVPCGSGVGASSILAGAVLAVLGRLSGRSQTDAELFTRVLYLEQLLSTGGGWQDQVGGIVGGVKLIQARPDAPLDLHVERLALAAETVSAMEERLVLFYTGRTRLAKNVLRTVMGRYLSRDARFLRANRAIQEIAVQMREALLAGDLDEFGWLMWMHWELQKILAAESTTPWTERLLSEVGPYIVGAKLLGAGGGGFMLLVAKEACVATLRQCLHRLSAGTSGRVYDFELATEGLRVAPCAAGDVPGLSR
jgi:fucokinase